MLAGDAVNGGTLCAGRDAVESITEAAAKKYRQEDKVMILMWIRREICCSNYTNRRALSGDEGHLTDNPQEPVHSEAG